MRRKALVMGAGAIGLAGALTAAALVAPNREAAAARAYVPNSSAAIVAHVPSRDPREVAERQALASAPDNVELAVELARAEIERSRSLSDPRYLGRAQALLARWWNQPQPPIDVLLLRATIEQSLHQFAAARADLDQLIAREPTHVQGHLTRAVVATVTADYAAARQSCAVLATHAAPVIAASCVAPLDALAGDIDGAYERLSATIDARTPAALRSWAQTTLAELATQAGEDARAIEHLRAVLAASPDDAYARATLADLLEPAAAAELLQGHEQIDNLLVRRAIAEHRRRGPEAQLLADMMRDRIAAAATRGDRVHLREEAMFVLAVEGDLPRALRLAQDNWADQKELTDARLLAEAALAAGNPAAAAPVIEWATRTGVNDVRLGRSLVHLAGGQ